MPKKPWTKFCFQCHWTSSTDNSELETKYLKTNLKVLECEMKQQKLEDNQSREGEKGSGYASLAFYGDVSKSASREATRNVN